MAAEGPLEVAAEDPLEVAAEGPLEVAAEGPLEVAAEGPLEVAAVCSRILSTSESSDGGCSDVNYSMPCGRGHEIVRHTDRLTASMQLQCCRVGIVTFVLGHRHSIQVALQLAQDGLELIRLEVRGERASDGRIVGGGCIE